SESIDPTYFAYAGHSNVETNQDNNGFTQYISGAFFTESAARKAIEKARISGFAGAHIVPLSINKNDAPLPVIELPQKEALYICSVDFEAENLHLSKKMTTFLEDALTVMRAHKNLKLRIVGHTDKMEKIENSTTIAQKRTRIIQNFLLANDIPAYRLQTKVLHEQHLENYSEEKRLPRANAYHEKIIIALVDQKEEIVLDKFQTNEVALKALSMKMQNVFKFITIA
ncbi:MAG: OmpA family protein, partial [Bacteroidota bacterium]